jgi:hypothetical protein
VTADSGIVTADSGERDRPNAVTSVGITERLVAVFVTKDVRFLVN